jgi:hypothetical protein
MSRVILTRYEGGDEQIVVGWDRPMSSYYWQIFNPEKVMCKACGGLGGARDMGGESMPCPDCDGAGKVYPEEEVIGFGGYTPNEMPTVQSLLEKAPDEVKLYITPVVQVVLQGHANLDYPASNKVVDMSERARDVNPEPRLGGPQ